MQLHLRRMELRVDLSEAYAGRAVVFSHFGEQRSLVDTLIHLPAVCC